MSTLADKRNLVAELAAFARPGVDTSSFTLPLRKAEEYRFTPIARVLEKAFANGFEVGTEQRIDSIAEFLIPGLDTSTIVLIDGVFSKELSSTVELVKADVFKLGKEDVPTRSVDPFVKITNGLRNDVVLLDVKGTIEKPVLLLHILTGRVPSVHASFAASIADGAACRIIDRTVVVGNRPVFHTKLETITVGKQSRVDFCKVQNTAQVVEVCNTDVAQADSSHVNTFTLLLEGILVRNNLSISIDGENCESHFHGLSLLHGETMGDHHTVVDHRLPNSFSNELYKGVMDDRSKGVFNGKIYVRPHAQKTNAFQSNRNILLTEQATINTKPQLEIWADDVKCSHGCTTGQLDDEAMFYLQSRGIAKGDARAMLLYAFAAETTELIAIPELKAYIDSLVTNRLHGSSK